MKARLQPGHRPGTSIFPTLVALAAWAAIATLAGTGCTPKPHLLPEAQAEKADDEAALKQKEAEAPPPPTDVEALRTEIAEEGLNLPRCQGTAIYTNSDVLEFWYALYGLRTLRGPTDVPATGLQTYSFTNQWGPQTNLRFDSPFQFYSGIDLWRPFLGLVGYLHEKRTGNPLAWLRGGRAPRCREEALKARAEQLKDLPPLRETPDAGTAPPPAEDPLNEKLKTLKGEPRTPWNTDPANAAPQAPAVPLRDLKPLNNQP